MKISANKYWIIPAIAFFALAGICFYYSSALTIGLGVCSLIGGVCCLQAIKH